MHTQKKVSRCQIGARKWCSRYRYRLPFWPFFCSVALHLAAPSIPLVSEFPRSLSLFLLSHAHSLFFLVQGKIPADGARRQLSCLARSCIRLRLHKFVREKKKNEGSYCSSCWYLNPNAWIHCSFESAKEETRGGRNNSQAHFCFWTMTTELGWLALANSFRCTYTKHIPSHTMQRYRYHRQDYIDVL